MAKGTFRRQGVAKEMLQSVCELSVSMGKKAYRFDTLESNKPVQALYDSLGYKRNHSFAALQENKKFIICIGTMKALHHISKLEVINSFGFERIGLQLSLLFTGIVEYVLLTLLSYKRACFNLDRIDL